MKTGKIPNDVLKDLISGYSSLRGEVLIGPGIGNDFAALDLGGDICVLSSDPITAAGKNAGRIAVHVAVNDAAACGAEPIGILTTILMPENTSKTELLRLVREISATCTIIGIDVIGGHTEVTPSVKKIIIVSTVVAKVKRGKIISISGAKPGDFIIMTKSAGLEGTSIMAFDHEAYLTKVFGADFVRSAKDSINSISVLKDGMAAAANGASAMHDITEGGLLGAIWEMCEASGTGAEIYRKTVPVSEVTAALCRHFKLDVLKLISSGSMLIACGDDAKMLKALHSSGVAASVVGRIKEAGEGVSLISINGKKSRIRMPRADEIYKLSLERMI